MRIFKGSEPGDESNRSSDDAETLDPFITVALPQTLMLQYPMQSDHTLVITTTDNEKEAEFLTRSLLEARLAACVQIVPVRSLYRWEGKIEEATE
jgi:hypothetical protein